MYLIHSILKDYYDGAVWNTWPEEILMREKKAINKYQKELADEINYYKFLQFEFFEQWMAVKKYERLGIDEYYANILGVKVPEITIPVAPGRNLAVIVETASLNQRLKNKGYFAAIEMNKKLVEQMKNTKNEK